MKRSKRDREAVRLGVGMTSYKLSAMNAARAEPHPKPSVLLPGCNVLPKEHDNSSRCNRWGRNQMKAVPWSLLPHQMEPVQQGSELDTSATDTPDFIWQYAAFRVEYQRMALKSVAERRSRLPCTSRALLTTSPPTKSQRFSSQADQPLPCMHPAAATIPTRDSPPPLSPALPPLPH